MELSATPVTPKSFLGTQLVCDCYDEDMHADNVFCYHRNLKYVYPIRGSNHLIDAAIAEGFISFDEAESLRVTMHLLSLGKTSLHCAMCLSLNEDLDRLCEKLKRKGYQI